MEKHRKGEVSEVKWGDEPVYSDSPWHAFIFAYKDAVSSGCRESTFCKSVL